MQRMHFCSGSVFITGDAIASSLLEYTRAVAMLRRSDVLSVPVVAASGNPGTVTLLLNEAVQLSSESLEGDGAEFIDDTFVHRVDNLTTELLRPAVWEGTAAGVD